MKSVTTFRKEILRHIKTADEEYYRLLKNSKDYAIEREDSPFFKKHHIYLVTIWDVSIEMAFYVSQNIDSSEISLITENLENMNSMARKDDLSIGHDNTIEYVREVIKLTRPYYKHVYIVSTFDDIPYRGYVPAEVEAERRKARLYLANKLHPPEVLPDGEHIRVELFLVRAHVLQKQVYTISNNGVVKIVSETVSDNVGFGY